MARQGIVIFRHCHLLYLIFFQLFQCPWAGKGGGPFSGRSQGLCESNKKSENYRSREGTNRSHVVTSVDRFCINKANHTELSEAIASMFRWYRGAAKCYVYLSDVSVRNNDNNRTKRTWKSDFRRSRWFTRGWTLQELIAPASVEFFSREGERLGNKNTLEGQIHEITQIPIAALRGTPLSYFIVDERMRWAAKRDTKRKEDKAYCLLGIFDVFIPLIYGEGENAFVRLKEEIDKSSRSKWSTVISVFCLLYRHSRLDLLPH
jgi:hypothetical protein